LIATKLAEAIGECRAMIVVLSKSSLASGWVEQEYNTAINQGSHNKCFRVIPIRIEECAVPGFLQNYRWIDVIDGVLDLQSTTELLDALYYNDADVDLALSRDIYVSRTWHANEAPLADYVCRLLDRAGFRLIGDMPDQPSWDETRIKSIISSCGGFCAIFPYRPNEQNYTSKYILEELSIADGLGLPRLVVAQPGVKLPQPISDSTVLSSSLATGNEEIACAELDEKIEMQRENWRPPTQPHYIFYATDLDAKFYQRNHAVERILQTVTATTCLMGQSVHESHIQRAIAERIRSAHFVIADISNAGPDGETDEESSYSINVCIEAGIARGAGVPLYLLARGERRNPPFMFRDQEVGFYADETELVGMLHQIAFPYRRRVINLELPW
jgi:hypothetical protein